VIASQSRADDRHVSPTIPHMLNDIELETIELECSLIDTLTPDQFERVQELVQATRILTTARCVLGEQERREEDEAARVANCGARPRHLARRRERLVRMAAISPSMSRHS